MSAPILIITNVPNAEVALNVARQLTERQLAACVNIMPPVHSIYRWQGKMEEANEIMLLIKSFEPLYAEVEQTIVELHPYEVPEVISLPISQGLPAYLAWMSAETQG